MDLGLEVILSLFSKIGLHKIFELAHKNNKIESENSQRIYTLKTHYINTIDEVISFLQGKNKTLAQQICMLNYLPQASRFTQLNDLEWAFGTMGFQDKAKHLATLYLEDLSDFIVECIDENFGFSRYAERLGRSANSFDELHSQLQKAMSYIDKLTVTILEHRIKSTKPQLICFSVPFPGNLYSAFRCAQYLKLIHPHIKIAMGGGFPTTELRNITDVRVFNYFDYITLDDGELALELLTNNITNSLSAISEPALYKRTFIIENNSVVFKNNALKKDYNQSELGTPDYSDLKLDKYLSVIEIANPMHSLWSNGRWNKLTMAHGCYWGKCTFCDGSLNYIKHFDANTAKVLVDRMEQLIKQTGETGFHFVDEAAPPVLMRDMALEILKRKLVVSWWTNIRFEKSFSLDLCKLLAASGCIAVSGGLEVASDRLLKLINKGVTVEQVAQVTHSLTQAGIMVHAYLMYGFPSQTIQETVDSLEMVRQLFEQSIIQSGFWHQFALTAHSPVGLNPQKYNITPHYNNITFANNDVQFSDKTKIDHNKFSFGLKKSLFNYMHGVGFKFPLQDWFEFNIPKTKIRNNYIQNAINIPEKFITKPGSKIIWIGSEPIVNRTKKTKKGKTWEMLQLTFHSITHTTTISLDYKQGDWLIEMLKLIAIDNSTILTYAYIKNDFEKQFDNFELFWYSKPLLKLKDQGLLVL